MKIICQTINLFGRHPAVAEHANLLAESRNIMSTIDMIKEQTTLRGLPVPRPDLLYAPMTEVSPNFQGFLAEKFSFL